MGRINRYLDDKRISLKNLEARFGKTKTDEMERRARALHTAEPETSPRLPFGNHHWVEFRFV